MMRKLNNTSSCYLFLAVGFCLVLLGAITAATSGVSMDRRAIPVCAVEAPRTTVSRVQLRRAGEYSLVLEAVGPGAAVADMEYEGRLPWRLDRGAALLAQGAFDLNQLTAPEYYHAGLSGWTMGTFTVDHPQAVNVTLYAEAFRNPSAGVTFRAVVAESADFQDQHDTRILMKAVLGIGLASLGILLLVIGGSALAGARKE